MQIGIKRLLNLFVIEVKFLKHKDTYFSRAMPEALRILLS